MNAFKRNAGKVLLGVSIAAGAAYATAGSVQEARAASKFAGELVGHFPDGSWRLIDPNGENDSWQCNPTPGICTGTLRSGVVAVPGQTYSDAQVDFSTGDGTFQEL